MKLKRGMSEDKRAYEFKVNESWSRLDLYLAGQLTEISRTQIKHLIKGGHVMVEGYLTSRPGQSLNGGERIQVHLPAPPPSTLVPQDMPLDILHEDDHILIVNKPAGLVTHPGHGVPDGTLVNGLVARFAELATGADPLRPGIVHRLDRDTSGVMVVARSNAALRRLGEAFEQRRVSKSYLALVWGTTEPEGEIAMRIARSLRNRLIFTTSAVRGRTALTRFKTRAYYGPFSYLEVYPYTGRTHQIRVHLAHLRHPIFQDAPYGGVRSARTVELADRGLVAQATKRISRQALHAWRLTFDHPVTGESLTFEAPLPEDFQGVLDSLRHEVAHA